MFGTRRWAALLVVVLVAVLTGCQAQVAVGVDVQSDASGTVRVSLGLDPDAAAKAGDLEEALRLDDLRAAGWRAVSASVEGEMTVMDGDAAAHTEIDGNTWVRMEKPFTDPAGFTAVMTELNPTVFRDFTLTKDSGVLGTTYSVKGTIDLTKGLRSFSDADLDAVEGDPVGSEIAAIEAREGRPAAEMVDVTMTVSLPGKADAATYNPKFSDAAPTTVDVSSTERSVLASLGFWVLAVLVLGTALVVLRSAYLRYRR